MTYNPPLPWKIGKSVSRNWIRIEDSRGVFQANAADDGVAEIILSAVNSQPKLVELISRAYYYII